MVGKKCEIPGTVWHINLYNDYPVADARDAFEREQYVEYLRAKCLISDSYSDADVDHESPCYTPTIEGWQSIEPRHVAVGTPGRCFVAMSFDSELDVAYFQGIKAALEDCGHVPVRMKELRHNEDITSRLLTEIRNAEYTVADFTEHRNGVYYEAAFARGLGRQVIMTCRDTDFEGLHFDTSHLSHIKWSAPKDLRQKLVDHIRATILPKA